MRIVWLVFLIFAAVGIAMTAIDCAKRNLDSAPVIDVPAETFGHWVRLDVYKDGDVRAMYLVDEHHSMCFFVYAQMHATGVTIVPCAPLMDTVRKLRAEREKREVRW